MKLELRIEPVKADEPRLTTCNFSVHVDDAAIWPVRGMNDASLEIQVDDLLSHLVEFWKPLLLQQTYPLSLNPARPSELAIVARARWGNHPEEQVEEEGEKLERFQRCHDLSRSFAGYYELPPLWFVRSGDEFQIDTGASFTRVSFSDGCTAFGEAGDWIASRLMKGAPGRWDALAAAWSDRNNGDGMRLLRLSTGLDEETVRLVADRGLLSVPNSVSDAANDNDELKIAARMASALPQEAVELILERVSAIPVGNAEKIAGFARQMKERIEHDLARALPYRQGEEMALSARTWLLKSSAGAVDMHALFDTLGIAVYTEDLGLPSLDALAIWGAKHGPAVILNSGSQRHQGYGETSERGAVRVTLAHELCHFLIDGAHALGAVEVLQSRMPVAIEQRARAFAGEFLLPTKEAAATWLDAGKPRDRDTLKQIVEDLCERFQISKSVASWKLEHGARSYGGDIQQMLEAIVPQRSRGLNA